MGGTQRFPYPKEVWSPSGGWWAYPKNWRVNTAISFVIIAACCVPVAMLSERKMEYVGEARHPIPWRPYVKVAEED